MIHIFLTESYDNKVLNTVLRYINTTSDRELSYLMGKGEADVCIEKGVFSNIEDVKIDSEFIDRGNLCILINEDGLVCSYYRGESCNVGSFVKERL
ncbi:hypothetical protein [Staphylococcus aureus]|uniref:TreC n=1 Tax=Staphylococcus phage phiIPLA-RODI TaxID=1572703 RepID=A0A0D3MV17_9CAUD|nr:TreC [Staphylococcus phage phiIPLA-RODI]AJA42156.1 TreC [Staphylococcus phage phiIPLA-RODI]WLY86983.1 hypothetical protein 355Saur083PP_00220 [Staphylococcus phage 355Saur083PP]